MLLTRIMPEFQELNWRQFSREESKKIIATVVGPNSGIKKMANF